MTPAARAIFTANGRGIYAACMTALNELVPATERATTWQTIEACAAGDRSVRRHEWALVLVLRLRAGQTLDVALAALRRQAHVEDEE